MCSKQNRRFKLAKCTYENGKYVESIIDNSVIMCDEITDLVQSATLATTKQQNNKNRFNKKCFNKKHLNKFLYFIHLLLITLVLLIAVNFYCYLIKYQ